MVRRVQRCTDTQAAPMQECEPAFRKRGQAGQRSESGMDSRQHDHRAKVMMKGYAGWTSQADRGRNLATTKFLLGQDDKNPNSAVNQQ